MIKNQEHSNLIAKSENFDSLIIIKNWKGKKKKKKALTFLPFQIPDRILQQLQGCFAQRIPEQFNGCWKSKMEMRETTEEYGNSLKENENPNKDIRGAAMHT